MLSVQCVRDYIGFKLGGGHEVKVPLINCFQGVSSTDRDEDQMYFLHILPCVREWLQDIKPSQWRTEDRFNRAYGAFMFRQPRRTDEAKFFFQQKQDALMFKLTWG